MKKLAMSFLSELSAAWLKRRVTGNLPVKSSQPSRETPQATAPKAKRKGPKPVDRPKPPSLHDIASNM